MTMQVNNSSTIIEPSEATHTIRLKHNQEHILLIKVWIPVHTWDSHCTQGQMHPHRFIEEQFISLFEEIQRWQRNCDHII